MNDLQKLQARVEALEYVLERIHSAIDVFLDELEDASPKEDALAD